MLIRGDGDHPVIVPDTTPAETTRMMERRRAQLVELLTNYGTIDCGRQRSGAADRVGPSAHGEFHPEAIRQMKGAGTRLKVNGEAIYATRPRQGNLWSEGDATRYTRSQDQRFVFAILNTWPGKQVRLPTVQPKPGSVVKILGSTAQLPWTYDSAQGTTITFPENLQQPGNRPCAYAWSLKMEVTAA